MQVIWSAQAAAGFSSGKERGTIGLTPRENVTAGAVEAKMKS